MMIRTANYTVNYGDNTDGGGGSIAGSRGERGKWAG